MKLRPAAIYIEFDSGTPIPPDQIIILTQPDGWLIVKVSANQRQLEGGFTIRGRVVALNTVLMETKQIKEMLTGQGLSKQEVEIILDAIKGVKIAPLAYSEVNAMTEDIAELKDFREKAQTAIAALGLGGPEPKKQRATRSDKGTTKTTEQVSAKMDVVREPVKEEPAKEQPVSPSKSGKKPTPRTVKASNADKKSKESEEDIKSNVANLGGPADDDEIPL